MKKREDIKPEDVSDFSIFIVIGGIVYELDEEDQILFSSIDYERE